MYLGKGTATEVLTFCNEELKAITTETTLGIEIDYNLNFEGNIKTYMIKRLKVVDCITENS